LDTKLAVVTLKSLGINCRDYLKMI